MCEYLPQYFAFHPDFQLFVSNLIQYLYVCVLIHVITLFLLLLFLDFAVSDYVYCSLFLSSYGLDKISLECMCAISHYDMSAELCDQVCMICILESS
jgi:hypothetical protein